MEDTTMAELLPSAEDFYLMPHPIRYEVRKLLALQCQVQVAQYLAFPNSLIISRCRGIVPTEPGADMPKQG